MFVRKTSKCALKNKPDIKDLKSQVTGCSDNTQRLSHRCFSLQDLQWHTSCPQKDPIPSKHKNTIFQCLNQFGVRASDWNTHHLLTSLSLQLCHFIRFFSCSHSFSSSYPPPFPFASRIGSHLLFFLFLHVSPSLFCFDSEKKFLKEAGVSFFALLAHLLCSFSLPVCHNMGLMKELAAFCLLSNIE